MDEKHKVLENLKEAVNLIHKNKLGFLIPEVQSNLLMALPGAKSSGEVAGFPGRIVRFKDGTRTLADPEFNVSRNMVKPLLAMMSVYPEIKAVMNITYYGDTIRAAKALGYRVSGFKRDHEPEDFKLKQGNELFEWGTLHLAREDCYDLIYDTGGWCLEPQIRVFGKSALEVAEKVVAIGKYIREKAGE